MVAFVVPEHQLGTAYGLYVPVSVTLPLISHPLEAKDTTLWVMLVLLCVDQHAVDPEPGTGSHCHGSRDHLGHKRISDFGSVFLHLHLQWVLFLCVYDFFSAIDTLKKLLFMIFHIFCLTVALMAVVGLYFVDYLRGKRRLEPGTLPLRHFSLSPCLSAFTSHCSVTLRPDAPLSWPPRHSFLISPCPSPASGGYLNQSAAARASLLKTATSDEE